MDVNCEGLLDVGRGQVVVMGAFNNIMAPTSGPAPEYLHLKILPPFTAMFKCNLVGGLQHSRGT